MIINRIFEWARVEPDKAALFSNDVRISYAVFARAIESARRFFASQALEPGRTAVVIAKFPSDAWVSTLALRALGLDTACVSSFAAPETLTFRNVACVVVGEVELAAFKPPKGVPEATRLVVVPKSIYRDIATGALPETVAGQSRFGGHILFTSGTTGAFKMVLQDGAREEKRNAIRAAEMTFDRNSVVHMQDIPPWTGAGFKQPSAIWHAGGTVVIDRRSDWATRCFAFRPTHLFTAPAPLKTLIDEGKKLAPGSIRGTEFSAGGGFVPFSFAKQVTEELQAKLYVNYSATEAGSLIMRTEFRGMDDLSWYAPLPGRTVRVVDAHGEDCIVGQEGRLGVVLTELDCTSYLGDREATANVFVDGTFFTGDIAVARADGRIRILGRIDDVVNIFGVKRPVSPVEQAIRDLLGVEEVCLFSGLNKAGEEECVVALQSSRTFPASELADVARKFGFDSVRFVVQDNFPHSETGMNKVNRAELRRQLFH